MIKLCAFSIALFAVSSLGIAQSPTASPPSELTSAHTMFLGYGGAGILGSRAQEGAAMLYSSAFKALSTAHYKLTTAPTDADLSAVVSIDTSYSDVTNGNSFENAFVRLAIFDTKTHALLWTIEEPLSGAFRKASFQKNIDDSVAKVVTDLNSLAAGKLP